MFLSRKRLAPLAAELIATFILTISVMSIARSQIGLPYFVALGAGLTMIMLFLIFGNESGAHANPALTFGLWTAKKIGTLKAILYIIAQFMGAALAWRLYTYMVKDAIPSIAGEQFSWQVFTAEAFGVGFFTLGVAAAIFKKFEGIKLAIAVGGSLTVGIIIASVASNAMINPAVALGAQSWSKEYVLGPLVGGLVGVNLYSVLFAGESLIGSRKTRISTPSKITFSSAKSKSSKNAATKSKSKKAARKKR